MSDPISFFGEKRRIFLHFINRELHDSLNRRVDPSLALKVIQLGSIAYTEPMFCNVSQLFEVGASARLLNEIMHLSQAGIFEIQTDYSSIPEFRHSRHDLYKHDRQRYPMYFQDSSSPLDRAPISTLKHSSTTESLAGTLQVWTPDSEIKGSRQKLTADEKRALRGIAPAIHQATTKREAAGITFALYRSHLPKEKLSPPQEGGLRRLLTSLYIDHYINDFNAVTFSGIPNLAYYDRVFDFPIYDYEVVSKILSALGIAEASPDSRGPALDERIAAFRSPIHLEFISILHPLLKSVGAVVEPGVGQPPLGRTQIINSIAYELSQNVLRRRGGRYLDFLEIGQVRLAHVVKSLSSKNPSFAERYALYGVRTKMRKRLLILTAVDIEDEVLYEELRSRIGRQETEEFFGPISAGFFGEFGGVDLYHVRSSAGSSGSNSATLVANDAIEKIAPTYVISVGICFGFRDKKDALCDVVVAEHLRAYELQRVTESASGIKITSRGERLPASPMLLDRARRTRISWKESDVHFGVVMSGDKLVDSVSLKRQLLEIEPEAVAGEMEGSGVSATCYRKNVQCILIKGICDWGENKTKEYQQSAARNAVRFTIAMVAAGGLNV